MLKEKLLEDLKNSMKEKNVVRKNVVQMIRAAILQKEKDNQIELNDEEIMQIIAKEAKTRKDALPDYEKSGREDLIKEVKEEIAIIEEYLPKQLTKEEILPIIQEIINKTGASSIKDMGKVMGEAKKQLGVSADGKTISECVKELLSK
ncbi:MAG: GatB/YqeY domain-containing protein [Clostridia bacterium]|jgi:gatB/yqeY